MPRAPIDDAAIRETLAGQQVVRVAFRSEDCPYLIPLGYVWIDAALYGVTDRGLKTRLAEADPRVAFQVDTSAETGVFEWTSVTGEGTFAVVEGAESQAALAALQPVIAAAPDWWRAEQGPKLAAGTLLVWRIRPTRLSGCRYVRG